MRARPKRPLYVMAKPPPPLARQIWSHPRSDKRRPPELLHMTMLPLVDLARFAPATLDYLCAVMAAFEAASFRVVFDRIEERHVVALRGSEPMRGALACQKKLAGFLRANGFPFIGPPPDVHITMSYRRDGLGLASFDPVSWRAEELLLVESVFGETRHVVHARRSLSREAAALAS